MLQVEIYDAGAAVHIEGHAGRRDLIVQFQRRIPLERLCIRALSAEAVARRLQQALRVHFLYALHDLEQAGAAGDAEGFQARGDREADGLFRAGRIRHHEIRRQGVHVPVDTVHRGIVRLEVDGDIRSVHGIPPLLTDAPVPVCIIPEKHVQEKGLPPSENCACSVTDPVLY